MASLARKSDFLGEIVRFYDEQLIRAIINKINNEQVAPLNSQPDDYHYPQQQQQQQQQFQYQPSNRRQPGYGERPRDRR
ncbi:unnamed protein product [Didymodactylos carnosus]|uniref:Uncharacterized protein n=1 Tax=Didymodactylos carnosus TaxID=1234261 RepID=A0A8S2IQJ1_9BILA|nr:unnamed protein product [Didymodactylos carnosus]CAF3769844.1 unnamed protein product [Didymodactylos carnosus]